MDNLKLFEWLMYASAADPICTFLRSGVDRWDIGSSFVMIVAGVALTWLAANRGEFWPVVVLVILTVIYAVLTLDHFVKFVPADIRPGEPMRTVKIVDVIGVLLAIASLYFYFSGRRARTTEAPAATTCADHSGYRVEQLCPLLKNVRRTHCAAAVISIALKPLK